MHDLTFLLDDLLLRNYVISFPRGRAYIDSVRGIFPPVVLASVIVYSTCLRKEV